MYCYSLFAFVKAIIYRGVFENAVQRFGLAIDAHIVLIAQNNYGHIFFYKTIENSVIAVPPTIVVNNFITTRVAKHTPAKAIVFYARFFK